MAQEAKHTPVDLEALDEVAFILSDRGQVQAGNLVIAAAVHISELRETLAWVRSNYASGSTAEINARIDAALAKAMGAA